MFSNPSEYSSYNEFAIFLFFFLSLNIFRFFYFSNMVSKINVLLIYFQSGQNSESLNIWKALRLEIIKQDNLLQTIIVSNTLLFPEIYCGTHNTVSTLAVKIHLLNFPLLTCCDRTMLPSP